MESSHSGRCERLAPDQCRDGRPPPDPEEEPDPLEPLDLPPPPELPEPPESCEPEDPEEPEEPELDGGLYAGAEDSEPDDSLRWRRPEPDEPPPDLPPPEDPRPVR